MNKSLIRNAIDEMYDGKHLYPPIEKLFKKFDLVISIDHPVGEDVIFINGKFNGYVSDWLEMLKISEDLNIDYIDYNDLFNKTLEYRT